MIEPFTQDEVKRLIQAATHDAPWTTGTGKTVRSKRATGDRDKAIMLVLLDTGLRASELCALRIDDYDTDRGRLHVTSGKATKSATSSPATEAQKALWRYLSRRPKTRPAEPLFATTGSRAMSRDNVYNLIRRAGDRADVRNAHPHRFRHTFAIEFLRNGGSAIVLQELLGHSKLDMILIYVKIGRTGHRPGRTA